MPARGSTFADDIVLIQGQYIVQQGDSSPRSEIVLVHNGTATSLPVNPATGVFATAVVPIHGMNTLELHAIDPGCHVGPAIRSFYHSGLWYPMESGQPDDALVPEGLAIYLGPEAWDDGDPDVDDLSTIATIAARHLDPSSLLAGVNLTGIALPGSPCTVDVTLQNARWEDAQVNLIPSRNRTGTWNVLGLTANISDLSADIVLAPNPMGPGCEEVTSIHMTIDTMNVFVNIGVARQPDGIWNVTLTPGIPFFPPTIDLINLNLDPCYIPSLGDFCDPDLRQILGDVLAGEIVRRIESDLPPLVSDLLNESQALSLDLATLHPDLPPLPLNVRLRVAALGSTTTRHVQVSLDTAILTDRKTRFTPLGSLGRWACVDDAPLGLPFTGMPWEAAIHDDVLNQALFASWFSDALHRHFTQQELIGLGMPDLSAAGITESAITMDPYLPPILGSCALGGDIRLQMGDVRFDGTLRIDGFPVGFEAFLTIEAPATVDLERIEDSTHVRLAVWEPTYVGYEITRIECPDLDMGRCREGVAGFVESLVSVVAMRDIDLPFPELDLHDVLADIPQGTLLDVDLMSFNRVGGYSVLSLE
jgi:hypothetical protein